jgi:hypothetical protein
VDPYPLLRDAVAQYVVQAISTWRVDDVRPDADGEPAQVEITQLSQPWTTVVSRGRSTTLARFRTTTTGRLR